MRFAAIYANGQILGYSPQEIDRISMWQFMAVCEGFMKANGGDDNKLSAVEADDLWDLVKDG